MQDDKLCSCQGFSSREESESQDWSQKSWSEFPSGHVKYYSIILIVLSSLFSHDLQSRRHDSHDVVISIRHHDQRHLWRMTSGNYSIMMSEGKNERASTDHHVRLFMWPDGCDDDCMMFLTADVFIQSRLLLRGTQGKNDLLPDASLALMIVVEYYCFSSIPWISPNSDSVSALISICCRRCAVAVPHSHRQSLPHIHNKDCIAFLKF